MGSPIYTQHKSPATRRVALKGRVLKTVELKHLPSMTFSTESLFPIWKSWFWEIRMTVLGHYRGSTNCLDVVRGIVWVRKPPLEVYKLFRTTRTEIYGVLHALTLLRMRSFAFLFTFIPPWIIQIILELKFLQSQPCMKQVGPCCT